MANYLNFLREELPVLVEDIPLETRREMWFQHDSCLALYSQNTVSELLPNEWIGRGSVFPWPPTSPDH